MKKLLVLGICAGALAVAAPARAGAYVSVSLGIPILGVQVGGGGVHVQTGPVAVGVGFPVRAVCAPAPVVYAAPPVCVRPVRVRAPRQVVAPPPFVVYQGPYPSHIAPPYHP